MVVQTGGTGPQVGVTVTVQVNGWGAQQQPGTPTPGSSPTTTSPPAAAPGTGPGVAQAPAAARTDGDVDLDLTSTVASADPTWATAASGAYTDQWAQTAANLAAARGGHTGTTYLRLTPPLDSSTVSPAAVQQTWRLYRDVLRRGFPQARLVLAVQAGRDTPAALTAYWPGDEAVDVLAVDARATDPGQAAVVESPTDPRGLQSWLAFAAARGKPVGVPDWGLDSGASTADGAAYLSWMRAALSAASATGGTTAGRIVYAAAPPAADAPATAPASAAPTTPPSTTPIAAPTAPPTAPPTATPTATRAAPSTTRTRATTSRTRSAAPPAVSSSGS